MVEKKAVILNGKKYFINANGEVDIVGDLDEKTRTVFIDKEMPKKFWEGIAVHEIVERVYVKKGHSYVYSHEKAQEGELAYYKKKYGNKKAEALLNEEEEVTVKIAEKRNPKRIRPKKVFISQIKERLVEVITYEGEEYFIDNSHSIHHAIVDIDEKKKTLYIDKSIPKKFFLGLALWQLEERKGLRQGLSYGASDIRALQKELEYFTEKYGGKKAKILLDEQNKLHSKHFKKEEKGEPTINRKVELG